MPMSEMDRMRRARTVLLIHHPFFGYLAAKLQLTEVSPDHPVIKTMATDGKHLFFNPKFTKILENNQVVTGVAHEVMHCVCCHHERVGSRDPEKWKKAADYAINPTLKDSEFAPISIPGVFEWLLNDNYRKMVAERIYDKLPDPPQSKGGGGGCGCAILRPPSAGQKEGEGDGNGEGQDDKAGQQESDPPVNWKRAAVEAAQFAKLRGKLPAGLEELVDGILKPRINWKRCIRVEMTQAVKNDWVWNRINRRYAHLGISMPTMDGWTTDVEFWFDTSGSIPARFFMASLGCVLTCAKQLKIKVNVGLCDAQVQGYYEDIHSITDVKRIRFLGRGGTDFAPAFEYAKKTKPSVLVYCTDLCGSFPQWRPRFRTLWIAPEQYKEMQVPFGKRLFIPMELLQEQPV
jgi:predicted metal-dependent peptidase